jgi:arylsulfatase A-like enzyme
MKMNYPRISYVVIGLLAVLAHSTSGFAAISEPDKPNILFIAIDDLNDWTGFLGGHPQVKTPHMDRLAKRGVNFTNAHCSAPGCSPSRNALLFGQEPFHSGLYAFYADGLNEELRQRYVSLPQFLKEHGYLTFGAGKIHHGSTGDPREWSDYARTSNGEALKLNVAAGYQVAGQFKMSFCPTASPLADHPDYQVASYGIDVLTRRHDQPFFLAVGIVKPHLPFICPPEFFDLYPENVDAPRINPTDLDDIPAVGQAMAKLADDRRFKQDEAWSTVRRAYLACISWADYNIGRVLDALEASPHADNTIIVLWSDHGYGMGEKNHFRKFALWEETTRVPFIIFDPRQKGAPADRTVTDAVSLINIYQTLADLVGLAPPAGIDGFSLTPQLRDPTTPLTEPAICSWGRGNYTVRDRDFRYTRYFDGGEELYAHREDPDEWINLADQSEHSEIKNRLAAFLPKTEAPLITKAITGVRAILSADEPTPRLLDKEKRQP